MKNFLETQKANAAILNSLANTIINDHKAMKGFKAAYELEDIYELLDFFKYRAIFKQVGKDSIFSNKEGFAMFLKFASQMKSVNSKNFFDVLLSATGSKSKGSKQKIDQASQKIMNSYDAEEFFKRIPGFVSRAKSYDIGALFTQAGLLYVSKDGGVNSKTKQSFFKLCLKTTL